VEFLCSGALGNGEEAEEEEGSEVRMVWKRRNLPWLPLLYSEVEPG
jgi:hypothetical protein